MARYGCMTRCYVQWGLLNHDQNDIWHTVQFPISFRSSLYTLLCSVTSFTHPYSAHTPSTWKKADTTNSSFVVGSNGTSSEWGSAWIALGM